MKSNKIIQNVLASLILAASVVTPATANSANNIVPVERNTIIDSTKLSTTFSENTIGDVDHNNVIDSSDASIILDYYAKLSCNSSEGISTRSLILADVNKDGAVDSSDASNVLEYYAMISTGQTNTFPTVKLSLQNSYVMTKSFMLIHTATGEKKTYEPFTPFRLEGLTNDMLYIIIDYDVYIVHYTECQHYMAFSI